MRYRYRVRACLFVCYLDCAKLALVRARVVHTLMDVTAYSAITIFHNTFPYLSARKYILNVRIPFAGRRYTHSLRLLRNLNRIRSSPP